MAEDANGQKPQDGAGEKPDEELESLEGVVDHVVFRNDENGYTVAQFKPLEGGANVVVVGKFVTVAGGMPLTLRGKWAMHARYGKQFVVADYHADIPRSEVGVRNYLTGFIKGVGPVMAKRIVKHFGENAIEIIEQNPERLGEVEGIGRKKAEMIAESWKEQNRIKDVMLFLQSHSVSPGYAMKIFKQYGESSVEVLRDDPYVLSSDIFGIGFRIADRIALNLGHEKDSRVRLRAGLMYVLQEAVNDGHVFLPLDKLMEESVRILEAPVANVEAALKESLSGGNGELIEDEGRVYLAPYHFAEKAVATRIAKLILWQKDKKGLEVSENLMRAVEAGLGFELSGEQRTVMSVLAKEPVVILTGGPGTGKTVTTKAAIRLFEQAGRRVLLGAPTGRAAKRLSEATGRPACTLHRLLEYKPQTFSFDRNEENPLEADLLVLDEMSMVDIRLMHHLLKAVKLTTKLLLVGDIDQLPSVGAGNILRDLIGSGCTATVRLGRIFRQQEGSTIIENAHLINEGQMPKLKGDEGSNFYFSSMEDPEKALNMVLSLVTKKIPDKFGFDPMKDIQVITPMYRGVVGVDNLNLLLQQALNPGKDIQCGARTFRAGDRVMQVKNNYDKEVFNGDVGIVNHINLEERKLHVEYPDHMVAYDFSDADQLVLAYAITVHKSQGTEYPAVVMAITTHHYPMLQRNLLYTAITRAKELVVLVGSAKAVALAVKNNKIEERHTALGERLSRALEQKDLLYK